MTTTYLLPQNSVIVGSPAPTNTTFTVALTGSPQFFPGPAVVSGFPVTIRSVTGGAIVLNAAMPLVPSIGDEVIQTQSLKDRIRMLLGDTDSDDWQLQDEEIGMLLARTTNVYFAAADGADAIAGKYSRNVNYQIFQEIREDRSDQQGHYLALAKKLRVQGLRQGIVPYAGGQTLTDKQIDEQNLDLVQPKFARDMMTEPGTEVDGEPDYTVIQPYY